MLYKKIVYVLLICLLSINSFGAVISDNDGSAFVTKAEFDSLKKNFDKQISGYNDSIDQKIDGAISSYLAGIQVSKTENCRLMLPNFSYPLYIVDKDNKVINGNVNSGSMYYSPKQKFFFTVITGIDKTPGAAEHRHWLWSVGITATKSDALKSVDFFDGSVATVGGAEVFVPSTLYTGVENLITMNNCVGNFNTYVAEAGRGYAVALDEYSTTTGRYNNHARGPEDNYKRYYRTDKGYDFLGMVYMSWPMNNNNDTKRFVSIDDWYGGTDELSCVRYNAVTSTWTDQIVMRSEYTFSGSVNPNKVLNYETLYLPVSYNKNLAYSNNKAWRRFYRPWTDYTDAKKGVTYSCNCHNVTGDTSYEDKTSSTSKYNSPLQALVNEGYGICAENHLDTTHTWQDSSLIKGKHINYKYIDNATSTTEYIKISNGIPLWHSERDCNCELTLNIGNVDTANKPILYVSSVELPEDVGSFDTTKLYNVAKKGDTTYTTSIELANGLNTISIKNVKKGDKMFFKILHGSEEDLHVLNVPTMVAIYE